MGNIMEKIDVQRYIAFPSYIYCCERDDLVDIVKNVSIEYLPTEHKNYDFNLYPVNQSSNIFDDIRIIEFSSYI